MNLTNLEKKYINNLIKTRPGVQYVLSDLKHHFKSDAWPLRHEYYYKQSNIDDVVAFNTILELNGYKLSYCKIRKDLMIRKTK